MVRPSLRGDRHPAAQRFDAIVRGAAFRSQIALHVDLEGDRALLASDVHSDRSTGRRALEHVQHAEVDGAGDLRRRGVTSAAIRAGTPARLAAARSSATSPPASSSGGKIPVGELLHLRQRPPRFALELVEERLRRRGIGVHRSRGDLEVGGEPHQILLHALVQRPLDAATFGIGGQRESCPRSSELLDLAAQPIEGCLRVGLLGLQRIPSCAWMPGSCPSSLGRRQAASTVSGRTAASRVSPGRHRRAGRNDLLASRSSTHRGMREGERR